MMHLVQSSLGKDCFLSLLPHLLFSISDALTYIKDQLSIVGNTRVKILTSQGNILVSLVTVTEAIDYKVSVLLIV